MRRPILAGCLILALASVASSQSGTPDEALSPMEVLAALAAAGPGGARADTKADTKPEAKADAKKKATPVKSGEGKVDHLTQCLRDWDAATHMTRQEWARTCRRVVTNREQFLREQEGK
jgi:hypothetical protein